MRVSVAGMKVGGEFLVVGLQVLEIVAGVTRMDLSPSVAR